jgi:hypothetical protein
MRRSTRLLVLSLVAALTALPVFAAEALTIRLVRASNGDGGMSEGLGDLQGILSGNLPFNRFQLIDSQTVLLPASSTVQLAGGFAVRCNGRQTALSVAVSRQGRQALSTTISLERGKPLILGGFPDGDGKLLVVLVAR